MRLLRTRLPLSPLDNLLTRRLLRTKVAFYRAGNGKTREDLFNMVILTVDRVVVFFFSFFNGLAHMWVPLFSELPWTFVGCRSHIAHG